MTVLDNPRLLPAPDPARPASGPTPPAGPRRGRRRARRSWSAWLVLLLVLAGAGYGGFRLVQHRIATESEVALDRVTLVADPVPVGSPDAAVVTSLGVTAGEAVRAGDPLAVIRLSGNDTGDQEVTLQAPSDGRVVTVDAQPGSVVRAGESVVTLYDPATLSFRTDLAVEDVERVHAGNTATISGPGLSAPVQARVERVLPVINGTAGSQNGQDVLTVVLTPADPGAVAQLVPGIPLTGTLDTDSASGGSVLDTGA